MRIALIGLLASLIAVPALAQDFYAAPVYGYGAPPAYGYRPPAPDAWWAARAEWHRARRAEDMARWRAANGDYDGASRAQFWADRHRERARWDAYVARGGGW